MRPCNGMVGCVVPPLLRMQWKRGGVAAEQERRLHRYTLLQAVYRGQAPLRAPTADAVQ